MKDNDRFFLMMEEPNRSCMLALRSMILGHDKNITESWKYGMPFFCYEGRMLCYLWVHKKTHQPYVGFVDGNLMKHKDLHQEKRSRMKVFYLDAAKDLPKTTLTTLLKESLRLRK